LGSKEIWMKTRMLVVLGAVGALLSAGPSAAADGKAVWDKACAGCHAMMAPKTGDKAAWAPFVKMGVDPVTAAVMKGKGMMPPKGGAASEADVKASVEYILSQMK
jgi:cytochrome c5